MTTVSLEAASDDWFGDRNDDGLPELAIGRLPVRTVAEADIVVEKLVAYDGASAAWADGVLFVADENDADYDFEGQSDQLALQILENHTLP